MPGNVKISAAADAGTLLSSDMLPLARSGDTNAYHATMAEVSAFANASAVAGTYNNTGRNLLHNAQMNVNQRASGPYTTNGVYTLDRWMLNLSSDSDSVSQQSLSDADRAAIGDEAATNFLQNVFAGNSAAGAYSYITQPIESVRRLGNKTVTISFWAKAASGTPKLGVNLTQNFGTGGAPSAQVVLAGSSVTLSTTYARYSLTFTLPSTSGKTLGSNGNDSTAVNIWFSSGTTNAANSGSVGVQSNTISLWGLQAEIGSASTPLAKRDPADDLALCQRFYQTYAMIIISGNAAAGNTVYDTWPLSVQMRATPTLTLSGQTYSNASGLANWNTGYNLLGLSCVVGVAGYFIAYCAVALSADL